MDIKEIYKKLDISWLKVGLMLIFGRRASLYEYLLDKANTGAHILATIITAGERGDTLRSLLARIADVSGIMKDCTGCLPDEWLPFALNCNDAIKKVYECGTAILTGKNITAEDIKDAISKFEQIYAAYKSND